MEQLLPELYDEIIMTTDQCDRWKTYAGLLAIPQFARTLTVGRILDWMEKCGVDVKINALKPTRIEWRLNGVIHRGGDLPAVVYANGTMKWVYNGMYHRCNDKPAVESTYEQIWCQHDKLHRDGDMPAIIRVHSNGFITQEWHQHGKRWRENNKPSKIHIPITEVRI